MMNKIYHQKGMPFARLMETLKAPGIIKPQTTNLGFSGVEIRSFFKAANVGYIDKARVEVLYARINKASRRNNYHR